VPALQARGLPLRAVEIEALAERPVVLDLLALTRALLHPADRIAWLAVLRAPWCGLSLHDLHAIAAGEPRTPLWLLLRDASRRAALSAEGHARIQTVIDALAPALADSRRGSLRDAVEGAWLRLGGADCATAPRDLDDARAFLDLLDSVAPGGELPDVAEIETGMKRLFAAPDAADPAAGPPVEIMTIHKAKGLEFDVVIVPGLHKRPRSGSPPLLAWVVRPREHGGVDLVLGTVAASGAERDDVHGWIGRLERERERLEAGRLLYVAATRARHRLHLLANADTAERKAGRDLIAPSVDSLLAPLWPAVRGAFEIAFAAAATRPSRTADSAAGDAAVLDPRTWRLRPLPALGAEDERLPRLDWRAEAPTASAQPFIEFSWAGESVRLVGTVVHRWLQRIADDLPAWNVARIDALRPTVDRDLASIGVPASERGTAVERALAALRMATTDNRGRWLLMPREPAARAASELRLTGVDQGRRVDIAIDRSFIEDGVRWVIDYKTGSHEGAGVDAFVDREVERYRPQLERYARLVAGLGSEPVCCGLYFPLLGAWRAWDAAA
jgi:ATP-dependent exoDNAse (exonuclease V) beta subunit